VGEGRGTQGSQGRKNHEKKKKPALSGELKRSKSVGTNRECHEQGGDEKPGRSHLEGHKSRQLNSKRQEAVGGGSYNRVCQERPKQAGAVS